MLFPMLGNRSLQVVRELGGKPIGYLEILQRWFGRLRLRLSGKTIGTAKLMLVLVREKVPDLLANVLVTTEEGIAIGCRQP